MPDYRIFCINGRHIFAANVRECENDEAARLYGAALSPAASIQPPKYGTEAALYAALRVPPRRNYVVLRLRPRGTFKPPPVPTPAPS
jgi:hypothetical protein